MYWSRKQEVGCQKLKKSIYVDRGMEYNTELLVFGLLTPVFGLFSNIFN
jgi:hypothetical protein